MRNLHQHTHRDRTDDLQARAVDVATSPCVRRNHLTPAEAAQCLSGAMSWLSHAADMDSARRACAELVRFDAAWSSSFGALPAGKDGVVNPHVVLLAAICRGLLDVADLEVVRSALSFWATETDPVAWQRLVAA